MAVEYAQFKGGTVMKLIVNNEIRAKYPDLRIGIVVAQNVNNHSYKNDLEDFVTQTFSKFASRYEDPHDLDDIKNIVAWRDIYRSFGINPKKKKPTAESLLARAIRSNYIPHISPAVDAYLCAETQHFLPIGGYDLTRINETIELRFACDNEDFFGVGAEETEFTKAGEVVYSDKSRVLTRCWNYRDCDYSKIDENTTSLALFSEAPLACISDEEVKETVEQMACNLKTFCDAECKILMLTKELNEIEFL